MDGRLVEVGLKISQPSFSFYYNLLMKILLNQKNWTFILLLIIGISLIPVPVFAERVISIEKTLPTEREKLMQVFSDLEAYPDILPEHIESSTIINKGENIAKMKLRFQGISTDANVKYLSTSPNTSVIEVVSGDLKGTKFTGTFSDTQNSKTLVKVNLELKTSWYISLATMFVSDDNIESMMNTSLVAFSNYANDPQPAKSIEKEKTCFLLWCW